MTLPNENIIMFLEVKIVSSFLISGDALPDPASVEVNFASRCRFPDLRKGNGTARQTCSTGTQRGFDHKEF